ncbi:hypothetical protein SOVF_190460 [Spinacia oleracea]|nr:hypothetical protein SOVF_190460 [Spinacia oleracea]
MVDSPLLADSSFLADSPLQFRNWRKTLEPREATR